MLMCIVSSAVQGMMYKQMSKHTFIPFVNRNNDILWNIIGHSWAEAADAGAFPLFPLPFKPSSYLLCSVPLLLLEGILMCNFPEALCFLLCAFCMLPMLQTASKLTAQRDAPWCSPTSRFPSPLLCSNNTSFLFPSPCLTPRGPGRPTPLNWFFSQLLPKSI